MEKNPVGGHQQGQGSEFSGSNAGTGTMAPPAQQTQEYPAITSEDEYQKYFSRVEALKQKGNSLSQDERIEFDMKAQLLKAWESSSTRSSN